MLNRCSNYSVKIACRQEKIQIIYSYDTTQGYLEATVEIDAGLK